MVTRRDELVTLRADLETLHEAVLVAGAAQSDVVDAVQADHRQSALNLVRYVEFRRHDLRALQARLAALGLSSLSHCESDVLGALGLVLAMIDAALGDPAPDTSASRVAGRPELLLDRAVELLGSNSEHRSTTIMVTLPSAAATDEQLVRGLVAAGMNIARINCAHDDHAVWSQMVKHLRHYDESVRIAFDLAGPKLRTSQFGQGPKVMKVKPRRDQLGRVTVPARAWLTASGGEFPPPDDGIVTIPVDDRSWIEARRVGDIVEFEDARGRSRRWEVAETHEEEVLVTATRTSYVQSGQRLAAGSGPTDQTTVANLPEVEPYIRVRNGERLVFATTPRTEDSDDEGPIRVGCTLGPVLEQVEVGDAVRLDDGKFTGVVEQVTHDEMTVLITEAPRNGGKLRGDKGINLPDTELKLPALTEADRDTLRFVAEHADLINYSFVQTPDDVDALHSALDDLDTPEVGIVLKVETAAAFRHLPELLLAAMKRKRFGVMIARGDLAVELGFDRLAEVQEEILSICEAAHTPVIWATEVLDRLAKTGSPTRSEISDAAQSVRAECVMLNKGPNIVDALETLDSVLQRMEGHRDKQRVALRRLHAWDTTTIGTRTS